MVLASYDFEISEFDLRDLCNCDEDGTFPANAVKSAVDLGVDAYQANLTYEELEDLIRQDITPIVFIRITEQANYSHAVVVYKISEEKLFTLDPQIGEREIEINQFTEIWLRGLTIVVEKN